MSAYKRLECKLVNREMLLKALATLGLKPRIHDTPTALVGFEGRAREELADISISRAQLNKNFTGASNDLGFLWSEEKSQYEMICSDYDVRSKIPQRIMQAYAKVVLEEALKQNRFTTTSTNSDALQNKKRVKVTIVAKKVI